VSGVKADLITCLARRAFPYSSAVPCCFHQQSLSSGSTATPDNRPPPGFAPSCGGGPGVRAPAPTRYPKFPERTSRSICGTHPDRGHRDSRWEWRPRPHRFRKWTMWRSSGQSSSPTSQITRKASTRAESRNHHCRSQDLRPCSGQLCRTTGPSADGPDWPSCCCCPPLWLQRREAGELSGIGKWSHPQPANGDG